jgi:hypothetical protein
VRIRIDHSGSSTEQAVSWLISSTGPATDTTTTPIPRRPARRGGGPASGIVTLGPPLRGRRYETTAIPEIRD